MPSKSKPKSTKRGSAPPRELHASNAPETGVLELVGLGSDGSVAYRAKESGTSVKATGRIHVRCADADAADEAQAAWEQLGFEVVQRPSWAPETAWIARRDGDSGRALSSLETLAELEGVVQVEPELLLERAKRG